MRNAVLIVGVVALVLAGASLLQRQPIVSPTLERGGMVSSEPATFLDLEFQTFEGETVTLNEYVGRPLVVNSWAAWCTFCKRELPDFAEIQEEFGDDVLYIAINRGESLEVQREFTDERGLADKLLFLQDPGDSFYRNIGGIGMPETVFLDEEGRVVFHQRGVLSLSQARQRTAALIN